MNRSVVFPVFRVPRYNVIVPKIIRFSVEGSLRAVNS